MDERSKKILLDYIPEKSAGTVLAWLDRHPVQLTITRRRHSKMGDYRAPVNGGTPRISVNGDLQPYAFLVTLAHELAHLINWEKHRRKVRPHGDEWKEQFRLMLRELLQEEAFGDDISKVVGDFAFNRISYRMFNMRFERMVHHIAPDSAGEMLLGDLPPEARFALHNGRRFIRKEKVRTRFRCQDLRNGRIYLISPLAKVFPVN